MLSRLALIRVAPRALPGVRCSSTAVQQQGNPGWPPGREVLTGVEEGPERDLVNFPRLKRPLHPGKVRLGLFPEEWFTALYPKTGVTGPYLFGTGFLTYLYSKEWLLTDHEFFVGVTIIIMLAGVQKKFGKDIAAYLDAQLDKEQVDANAGFNAQMKCLQEKIQDEAEFQMQMQEAVPMLYAAKKDNVALQLETEFRRRQLQVYEEVKKRLDYQLEVTNIERRLQQKHMVNWVISNVMKGISAKQEKDMLAKCIVDLKSLAGKA